MGRRAATQQARAIARPSATRAVAAANGQNKVSIIVPCHRVIGSDGSLTGLAAACRASGFCWRWRVAPLNGDWVAEFLRVGLQTPINASNAIK